MSASFPIGVFDSGVGGLSILREIRQDFPNEDLLYVADSAYVPYGDKTPQFVESRSVAITQFLIDQKAKAIVVACNTATAFAIATLRSRFSLPIIGIEPALKPAVGKTASGIVGVLATNGTLSSEKFAKLLERFGDDAEILIQPCPGLVEQVETGDLHGETTRALVVKYISPLLERGSDTIILGCTHYAFLAPLIREITGPGISIIDPAVAIAQELRRRLEGNNLLSSHPCSGRDVFWTSGNPDDMKPIITELWKANAEVKRLPVHFYGNNEI